MTWRRVLLVLLTWLALSFAIIYGAIRFLDWLATI